MRSLPREMGPVHLLAFWIRMTMPLTDCLLLASFLKDARDEFSSTERRQIDTAIEILELPEVEEDAWIKSLLSTARPKEGRRKLEN